MARVEIWRGPAGTGKTTAALAEYRATLHKLQLQGRIGQTLWLTPTHRSQRALRQQLALDSSGDLSPRAVLAPQILTFEAFAERVLAAAGLQVTPVSEAMQRQLLRHVVAGLHQSGKLSHFAPVAHTSGLLDQLTRLILDLKRAEVWPEELAALSSTHNRVRSRKDAELTEIYRLYQQRLTTANRYDSEGRFWLARTELQQGGHPAFDELELVVIAGFADFTQSQYETLGLLARRARRLVAVFDDDTEGTRDELFARPRHAQRQFITQLPSDTQIARRWFAAPSRAPAAVRVIANSLFGNPRQHTPVAFADGLEIAAATGSMGEIDAIGLRLQEWLHAGVSPEQIVVVVRDQEQFGSCVCEAWRAAGLPVSTDATGRLGQAAVVQRWWDLLRCELADWSFTELQGVLAAPWIAPTGMAAWPVAQALWVLRRFKLHAGQRRIEHLARERQHDEGRDGEAEGWRLLEAYAQFTRPLRQSHTWEGWIEVLTRLSDQLGMLRPTAYSALDERDRLHWELLQGTLRRVAEVERFDQVPRRLTLSQFAREFRDLVDHEQLPAAPEPADTIRILGPEQARHISADYLVLMQATESIYPRGRGDDCLYSEGERRVLAEQGCVLGDSAARQQSELLLFYQLATRARQRLIVSFPAIDSRGQPVYSSPYVTAIESLFVAGAVAQTRNGQLDPVPPPEEALGPRQRRLAAVRALRFGRPDLISTLWQEAAYRPALANYWASVSAAVARFATSGFTAYEGRLALPGNVAQVAAHYGARHQFSVSQLESYATCRFRFWMEQVLRVRSQDQVDASADPRLRGEMVHEVVAQVLVQLGPEAAGEEVRQRFLDELAEAFGRRPASTTLMQALQRIEHEILGDWADAYAHQTSQYAALIQKLSPAGWRSLPPELQFGVAAGTGDAGDYPAVEFATPTGPIAIGGRIDRVDTTPTPSGTGYIVIDYKTGQAMAITPDDVATGRKLQLPMYLLAIQRLGVLGEEAVPLQCGYWRVGDNGFTGGVKGARRERAKETSLDDAVLYALATALDEVIPRLVGQLRQGRFEVLNTDDKCTAHCDYSTVCRVQQVRSVEVDLQKTIDVPQ